MDKINELTYHQKIYYTSLTYLAKTAHRVANYVNTDQIDAAKKEIAYLLETIEGAQFELLGIPHHKS